MGKKRRRASGVPERRSKRRRSGANAPEESEAPESQPEPVPVEKTMSPVTRRSSRRTAGLKGAKLQGKDTQNPAVESPKQTSPKQASPKQVPPSKELPPAAVEVRDGGDTDEELMSQLVAESRAASHHSQEDVVPEVPFPASDDSMDLVAAVEAEEEAVVEQTPDSQERPRIGDSESQDSKTNTLMDMLRGGLDELRGAALSRDEVYRLEDLLMDMKRELFEAERRGRR